MLARALMVQGTASSVGKSLLVTALCRYFRSAGVSVAPFKSQNMALNAAVTPGGLELGRAQAVQAEAAGLAPRVEMNPILLKPEGDSRAQVVVLGKPIGSLSAAEYHAHKPALEGVIAECLRTLRSEHELVVIEGAGSPAEINLKSRDIVNMHVARAADARVLLVGDIDRGGVFAAFVGTLELLEPDERARVAAFVINKFRGDKALLAPGLDMLSARTQKPVLGVLPYLRNLGIADEDSLSLDERQRRRARPGELDIAVVRPPRISNHDDFLPLEHEAGVCLRFVEHPSELTTADLVIVPGSKHTVADLAWLRERGFGLALEGRARAGEPVLGICGGCQMLGQRIEDPSLVESSVESVPGLGLLPVVARFGRQKVTAQVRCVAARPTFLTASVAAGTELSGYEIHMGVIGPCSPEASRRAPFEVTARNGHAERSADGASDVAGVVVGTMIHGLFDNVSVRASLLGWLRARRGQPQSAFVTSLPTRDEQYDRLATTLREHLDLELLWRTAGIEGRLLPV